MKNLSWENLLTRKNAIIALVIISAITWASSITPEFTGYDDIKLIVNNERIHKGPLYTAKFYGNIVSDSHNVAWTNYPTVIYRPLEWFGSAVGYAIWGPHAVPFHMFFNINFHIINTILLFLIMTKVFAGTEALVPKASKAQQKGKFKAFKNETKTEQISSVTTSNRSVFLAFCIALLWTVHPLHSEAINMLTSGVGFLWATFFGLSAIVINIYFNNLSRLRDLVLIAWSCISFILSYMGSEMAIIGPTCLFLYYLYSKLVFNREIAWGKVTLAFLSIWIYMNHRSSIVSETHAWASNSFSELIERLTVLAPEIFFHYIKLYFYPAVLSVDQHHQVILADQGTPYHILCLSVSALFVIGLVYFLYTAIKTPSTNFIKRQSSFIIAFAILITGLSIGIALNIIPLYVLARDRYTYIFCLGLTTTIVFLIFNYLYAGKDNSIKLSGDIDLKQASNKDKLLAVIALIALLAFSARSFVRNLDWHDGEKMWYSTINSVPHDPGVQQVWRSRLLDYYKDPGTKTFKPDPFLYQKCIHDFNYFAVDYKLNDFATFKRIKSENEKSKMVAKYAYTGPKTIASGLFFLAMKANEQKQYKQAFELFRLGHNYYPEHFQININLLVQLHSRDPKATEYLIKIMDKEATNNPFLAKGFMDTLHLINSPHYYELAKKYRDLNPNTQVFDVFLFNASYMSKRYDVAYEAAKRIVKKYHEEKSFDQYVQLYEAGRFPRSEVEAQ